MTAAALFEKEKESLRGALESASPEEAGEAMRRAFARVTDGMAEQAADDEGRQRVRAVMSVAARSAGFLAAGSARAELVVASQEKKTPAPGRIALLAGAAVLVLIAAWLFLDGRATAALATLIGGLLLFGAKAVSPAEAAKARGIAGVDAERALSAAAEACRAADTCLADLEELEREGRLRAGLTADEALLTMLGNLMEAKEANRPDLALGSLQEAEQFLRLSGIEALPYDEKHAAYFDVLPTLGGARTIRPAFLKEGRLLQRGTAAVPQRRTSP